MYHLTLSVELWWFWGQGVGEKEQSHITASLQYRIHEIAFD